MAILIPSMHFTKKERAKKGISDIVYTYQEKISHIKIHSVAGCCLPALIITLKEVFVALIY